MIAKLYKVGPKSYQSETIQEHTSRLLNELQRLKNAYAKDLPLMTERMWQLLKWAVIYHDIGKANSTFQNKLYRIMEQDFIESTHNLNIPHNILSVGLIPTKQLQLSQVERKLLFHAVGYHHERKILLNYIKDEVKYVLENDLFPKIHEIKRHMNYSDVSIPMIENVPSLRFVDILTNRIEPNKEEYIQYVLLKGLLHRLDHAASAHLPVEVNTDKHIGTAVNDYFEKNHYQKNDLQIFCSQHQNDNVIALAQTGLGKTEAGLLWIGESKGFFTLPLRTSLNAMYERMNNEIGYKYVHLLHSNSMDFLLEQDEYDESIALEQQQQAHLLSSKLLLTTVDQILKFPMGYLGHERELATLAYSKLVIDEIQSYDLKISAILIKALEIITKFKGKFMIITATLPNLYLKEIKKRVLGNIVEGTFTDEKFNQRHRIELHDEEINEHLEQILSQAKEKQVLIIVNTVKKAKKLYHELQKNNNNVYLLHSEFINKHRQILEKEIKEYNRKNKNGIWITTQLVEVSLNIDFDVLFTEMSTLDSMFQRFGRCYRKRNLDHPYPNVHIFTKNMTGVSEYNGIEATFNPTYSSFLVKKSIEFISPYNKQILNERLKIELVDQLYSEDILKSEEEGKLFLKDFKTLLSQLDNWEYYDSNKKQAQALFRDIRSILVIPVCFMQTLSTEISEYEKTNDNKRKREIKHKLQQHSVQINENKVLKYTKKHGFALEPLTLRGLEYFYVLDVRYEFDEKTKQGIGLMLQ